MLRVRRMVKYVENSSQKAKALSSWRRIFLNQTRTAERREIVSREWRGDNGQASVYQRAVVVVVVVVFTLALTTSMVLCVMSRAFIYFKWCCWRRLQILRCTIEFWDRLIRSQVRRERLVVGFSVLSSTSLSHIQGTRTCYRTCREQHSYFYFVVLAQAGLL